MFFLPWQKLIKSEKNNNLRQNNLFKQNLIKNMRNAN